MCTVQSTTISTDHRHWHCMLPFGPVPVCWKPPPEPRLDCVGCLACRWVVLTSSNGALAGRFTDVLEDAEEVATDEVRGSRWPCFCWRQQMPLLIAQLLLLLLHNPRELASHNHHKPSHISTPLPPRCRSSSLPTSLAPLSSPLTPPRRWCGSPRPTAPLPNSLSTSLITKMAPTRTTSTLPVGAQQGGVGQCALVGCRQAAGTLFAVDRL